MRPPPSQVVGEIEAVVRGAGRGRRGDRRPARATPTPPTDAPPAAVDAGDRRRSRTRDRARRGCRRPPEPGARILRRCPTDCHRPARRSSGARGPHRRASPAGRHGPPVRGPRRLVAGPAVGDRRRGRRALPRCRSDRRAATGPTAGPPRAGHRRGPVGFILEDAGRLQLRVAGLVQPDDPSRPWRVAAGRPRRLPIRARARRGDATRTSLPRRSWPRSSGRWRASIGRERRDMGVRWCDAAQGRSRLSLDSAD